MEWNRFRNLKSLKLDFSFNELGEYRENLKELGEGMKYLPYTLLNLTLNLTVNKLGENIGNMKCFGEATK